MKTADAAFREPDGFPGALPDVARLEGCSPVVEARTFGETRSELEVARAGRTVGEGDRAFVAGLEDGRDRPGIQSSAQRQPSAGVEPSGDGLIE
jgi:hypothetical protein